MKWLVSVYTNFDYFSNGGKWWWTRLVYYFKAMEVVLWEWSEKLVGFEYFTCTSHRLEIVLNLVHFRFPRPISVPPITCKPKFRQCFLQLQLFLPVYRFSIRVYPCRIVWAGSQRLSFLILALLVYVNTSRVQIVH